MEHCPVCEAEVDDLWRQEGSHEIPLCECCNEPRMETRTALHERWRHALAVGNSVEDARCQGMLRDFYGLDG